MQQDSGHIHSLAALSRKLFGKNSPGMPSFLLITDFAAQRNSLETIKQLPEGSGIIFRDYDLADRDIQAQRISRLCRERGIFFSIARDIRLAKELRAPGMHFPEYLLPKAIAFKRANPQCFVTIAAHSEKTLRRLRAGDLDAVIISPLFETVSHPEARPLGLLRLRNLLGLSKNPAYILGGINLNNIRSAGALKICGVACIRGD